MEDLIKLLELIEYENELRYLGLTEEEIEGNRAFMDWTVKDETRRS